MKKLVFAIAILLGISTTSMAQTDTKMEKAPSSKMSMKDGVMMSDNKMMLCSKGKCSMLTATYSCSDGCKISTDGTVTKPDGSTMKLKNGYAVSTDGKVSMIPHGQKGHVCDASCPMGKKM